MTRILFNASPSATYRFRSGVTIPYWLFLRVLNLLLTWPVGPGKNLALAFVTATLRREGFEVSERTIATLGGELVGIGQHEKTLLRNLDPDQMRPRYGEIPFTHTRAYMESITPYLTVPGSMTGTAYEMGKNSTPASEVRFGLVVTNDTDRSASSRFEQPRVGRAFKKYIQEAEEASKPLLQSTTYENFDLSQASAPINNANYNSYLRGAPQLAETMLSQASEPQHPNDLPTHEWPRAPAFGTSHVDPFTGLELVHEPIASIGPTVIGNSEGVDAEAPLLGEDKSPNRDTVSPDTANARRRWGFADKALAAASSLKSKVVGGVSTDFAPFSRWSSERFSFERISSASLTSSTSPTESREPVSRLRNKLCKRSPAATDIPPSRERPSPPQNVVHRLGSRSQSCSPDQERDFLLSITNGVFQADANSNEETDRNSHSPWLQSHRLRSHNR